MKQVKDIISQIEISKEKHIWKILYEQLLNNYFKVFLGGLKKFSVSELSQIKKKLKYDINTLKEYSVMIEQSEL